ncbi:MAG: thioredoxin family protein [Steroidobacteraceae bacterium]
MRFQSLMTDLGTPAPAFDLPDGGGRRHRSSEVDAPRGLLVAFICNHCPFVLHLLDEFVRVAAEYRSRGIATVAISSNDVAAHPEDGPAQMLELAWDRHFGFPYLYDESQSVAQAYGAVCTPDFFLYDGNRRLYYRGQFDSTRPVTPHTSGRPDAGARANGADLRAALDALARGQPAPTVQRPSMGCSMKWKPGNDPDER